ncbi:MAG: dockerin type I domain-containing protein [Bacteroidetes bacterium]|nr:dockerin type I domain-containing protein [Bacteroidota bacterium]
MKTAITFFLAMLLVGVTFGQISTNGLVAWYPFNGNALDMSGNGNSGTVNGATICADRFGSPNSAYNFDGMNDYIGIPSLSTLDYKPITYSVWINLNEYISISEGWQSMVIIGRDRRFCGSSGAIQLFSSIPENIDNEIDYYTGSSGFRSYYKPNLNEWVNITFTLNEQDSAKLFINGTLVNNGYFAAISDLVIPLLIGCRDNGSGGYQYFFKGKIDDIRIYNRALSQSEITALYNESSCPGETGSKISSTLRYNNNAQTPLSNSTVYLKTQTGVILDSTTTDLQGNGQFCGVENGDYFLTARTTKPTGGINNTDALIILRHFMGYSQLTGLKKKAADCNGSGYINTTDALLVQKRFMGLSPDFSGGNWVFEEPTITISSSSTYVVNIKGLCMGDVNGDNTPPVCYPLPTVANAGTDQLNIEGITALLSGNTPGSGETGTWSILSGTGGSFLNIHNPTASFTGNPDQPYTLQWMINNYCDTTFDNVTISFFAIMGIPCPGIPSFEYGDQTYNTVQIGNQCWMKENLNIGNMIEGSADQTDNGIVEKYCFNNEPANCVIYGGLYKWDEMMQYITTPGAQGICPSGWHLPDNDEWTSMVNYLGGSSVAGGKLKETGTEYWYLDNGANNESGFTALGAGYYYWNFDGLLLAAGFWNSSEYSLNNTYAWYSVLSCNGAVIEQTSYDKIMGLSVRCLKDTP